MYDQIVTEKTCFYSFFESLTENNLCWAFGIKMTRLYAVKFLSPNYTVNIWCVINQRSSISRGLIIIQLSAGCSDLFFNTQEQSVTQDVIRLKDSSMLFYFTLKTANTILESESSWVIQYHNQRYTSRYWTGYKQIPATNSSVWNKKRKRDVTKITENRWCYRRWR